jgi:peptidylprolyl isomerase
MTTQSGAEAGQRPEPTVTVSVSRPPRALAVRDLIRGSGRAAQEGDELAVHFAAVRFSGEFFESIWEEPFSFELDSDEVSPGWVRGLPGMRVGGRRELIVPTQLTSRYGIPPSENDPRNALIYVVDLLEVKPGDRRERTEPTVRAPAGAPPGKLVVEDLIEGRGTAAAPGDVLTVEYVGVYWDGRAFSNSWDREDPFSFRLGSRTYAVNPGWERGLVGMRVGGRRELVVPPGLLQQGGALPESEPADTLVYVVDLVGLDRR